MAVIRGGEIFSKSSQSGGGNKLKSEGKKIKNLLIKPPTYSQRGKSKALSNQFSKYCNALCLAGVVKDLKYRIISLQVKEYLLLKMIRALEIKCDQYG